MAVAYLLLVVALLGSVGELVAGSLDTFGPSDPAVYDDLPEQNLERLRFVQLGTKLSFYWAWGMLLLTAAGGCCIAWSSIEARSADRLLRSLKSGAGADSPVSLADVDELLETAKAQAAAQQQELAQLEARIAAAEQLRGPTDDELRRVGDVLGLTDLVGETKRWGWLQVALAIAGLVVAIALYLIADLKDDAAEDGAAARDLAAAAVRPAAQPEDGSPPAPALAPAP